MKTIDGQPPLIDDDGEVREITDADMHLFRPWQPGDPVQLSEREARINTLRVEAQHLRERAAALESEAESLERAG